jgi:hypothetical protein
VPSRRINLATARVLPITCGDSQLQDVVAISRISFHIYFTSPLAGEDTRAFRSRPWPVGHTRGTKGIDKPDWDLRSSVAVGRLSGFVRSLVAYKVRVLRDAGFSSCPSLPSAVREQSAYPSNGQTLPLCSASPTGPLARNESLDNLLLLALIA